MDNEQMARMGIKEGMIGLAYEYEFGMNRDKDIEKAIYWYEKAGDSESIERANNLK